MAKASASCLDICSVDYDEFAARDCQERGGRTAYLKYLCPMLLATRWGQSSPHIGRRNVPYAVMTMGWIKIARSALFLPKLLPRRLTARLMYSARLSRLL